MIAPQGVEHRETPRRARCSGPWGAQIERPPVFSGSSPWAGGKDGVLSKWDEAALAEAGCHSACSDAGGAVGAPRP